MHSLAVQLLTFPSMKCINFQYIMSFVCPIYHSLKLYCVHFYIEGALVRGSVQLDDHRNDLRFCSEEAFFLQVLLDDAERLGQAATSGAFLDPTQDPTKMLIEMRHVGYLGLADAERLTLFIKSTAVYGIIRCLALTCGQGVLGLRPGCPRSFFSSVHNTLFGFGLQC